MSLALCIGVKDYRVFLEKNCPENDQKGQLSLTFSLQGNFLAAALSDDLTKTVDYHQLSISLTDELQPLICLDEAAIRKATETIFRFSPLITGCYLKITACCHGALIVETSLLRDLQ